MYYEYDVPKDIQNPFFSLAGLKILLNATWYNSKTSLDSRVLF